MTPQLRFPEFAYAWQVKRLEDIAKIQRGRFSPRPRNDPRYYGGDIPFVQTGDVVKSDGVISKYSQTLNEEGLRVSKLFPEGTILITIAANIGHTGILSKSMACPDSLIGISCNHDVDSRFLNYYLSTQQKRMDNVASEAAQKNINVEFLKPYQVPCATKPEQEKIADFLTAVDERIAVGEQQYEQLARYKRGVMQQIFSQKIRFKDENGNNYPDWESKRLGEVFDYEQPTKYIVQSTEYDDKYSTPVLTAGKTFTLGYTNEAENIYKNTPVVIFDDFTTSSHYVNFDFKVKSSAMKILKAKDGVNTKIAFELLQRIRFVANDHKRFWIGTFQDFSVMLPTPQEQQKIADFLTTLDDRITTAKTTFTAAKQFKKALLQRMFV